MEQYKSERKFLVLSVIAGVCASASLASLFVGGVPFSLFPILAFVLAVYCFYQQHVSQPMTEGTPMITFACFLVGAFGYSAFIRVQLPELGGNFISIIITMALLVWVARKVSQRKPKAPSSDEAEA